MHDKPSTLNLVYPHIFYKSSQDPNARVDSIVRKSSEYLNRLMDRQVNGMVMVER